MSAPTADHADHDAPVDLARLDAEIAGYGRVLVALSGGADSALVAARAAFVRPDAAAATLTGPLFPCVETERARAVARQLHLPLHEIPLDALALDTVRANPPDRCYHCKKEGMGRLVGWAREHGFDAVLDGQNIDDLADDRPGARAAAELHVRSPLRDAGFTKAMIRRGLLAIGLSIAAVPASACLASRIPYGTPLTDEALRRIERAEAWLRSRGYAGVRVRERENGTVACIEASPDDFPTLVHAEVRTALLTAFRALGYPRVVLDIAGYHTGGANR